MTVELRYRLRVTDKYGLAVSDREAECHSFVSVFMRLLFNAAASIADNVTDTGGTARPGTPRNSNAGSGAITTFYRMNGINIGPVVGTSAAAEAAANTALGARITHGVGAGQLSHSGVTFGALTVAGLVTSFTMAKTFTNNSGADITVNEVGLYSEITDDVGTGVWTFCLVRDVIAATVVPSGGAAQLTYTISVTT